MRPSISAGRGGVEVVDPIERRRLVLETPERVEPAAVSTDAVPFPVDVAARVVTTEIAVTQPVGAFVRDPSGAVPPMPTDPADDRLPAGEYVVELNAPVKLYLAADGPLRLATDNGVRLAFDEPTPVVVGARSYHRHPSGTITTTADPGDLRTAVAALSSALKTTAPERSYPTLRGHPPLLELGDELDVPDGLSRPDVGVRLVVPDSLGATLTAAPLAYYLGADVAAGRRPRVETDSGFEHALASGDGFERSVARTLEQAVFFDCLLRTEGYTGVPLRERDAVEAVVDVDFARVYGLDFESRLEAALSVPFDRISDHFPTWGVAAHLPPRPSAVETLPFAVDRLASVWTETPRSVTDAELKRYALGRFFQRTWAGDAVERSRVEAVRGTTPIGSGEANDPDRQRAPRGDESGAAGDGDPEHRVVTVSETNAMEDVWFGDGIPLDATKGVTQAYRNALDQEPRAGAIDITVVCNESEMGAESTLAATVYGARSDLPFDVTVRTDLSRAELREALAEPTDFFHYVGHVDADGFQCRDGALDAATLDAVGVDTFFLNACQSYEQGHALVDRGAIGGVVTFSDVLNESAVRLGGALARLLNIGFPLSPALSIASTESIEGASYLVIGADTVDVVQDEIGLPILYETDDLDSDPVELTVRGFLPSEGGMGTLARPLLGGEERYVLAPGVLGEFDVPRAELREFFGGDAAPVRHGKKLVWANEYDWDA